MKSYFCRIGQVSLLALAFTAASTAQQPGSSGSTQAHTSTVELHTFVSNALQRTMPYEVVLPVGYASSQQRYPVLYLLHGWHGDETNYIKLTQLVNVASAYPIIVVMPRGNDSWYVNSAATPTDHYADYIFSDVVSEVDKQFRTVASPQSRAIAGLSMGGYGALLLSLQHPGAYRFVGSLSGAFAGPTGIEKVMPALKPSTDAAFGASDSDSRKKNDLDILIAADDPASQPYLFLACGTRDPLLASDRHVVEELSERNFAYEYHEMPGAHTWTFWNSQLEPMFAALAREMHVTRVAPDPSVSPLPATSTP
ncbi:MAG TPA: alpha/beta hydrolase family protein [Acidobacteriaceae bacterium]|jgi:S-formylglutathione hydrolase FrmB